jgi:hypothetical protein
MGRDWCLGLGTCGRPGLEECDIVKVSTERIGGLRIAAVICVDDLRPPDHSHYAIPKWHYDFAALSCPHDGLVNDVRWLQGERRAGGLIQSIPGFALS